MIFPHVKNNLPLDDNFLKLYFVVPVQPCSPTNLYRRTIPDSVVSFYVKITEKYLYGVIDTA